MSRTITAKRSHRSPPGDTVKLCGYCGIAWYRSQLFRDAAGILVCPDDRRGRDVVTLSEGNAQALANKRQLGQTGMPSDGTVDSPNTDAAPQLNWNAPSVAAPNVGPTGQLSVQVFQWLRGDQVVLGSGGGVAQWTDQSGSGNSLPAPTLAAQPNYSQADATLNGLPTVSSDGVNHFLSLGRRQGAPFWVWMVAKQLSFTGSGAALFNMGFALAQKTVSPQVALVVNSITPPANAAATVGSWARFIAVFNVAGTDSLTIHSTTVTNASQGQRTGLAMSLFSGFNGAGKTSLSVAEFLVTTPAPSAAEIAAIEAYGLGRYGAGIF